MTILPLRTALGVVSGEEYQSGYVAYPGCLCPNATHIQVSVKGVVNVTTSGIDGRDWFVVPVVTIPWSSVSAVPIGNVFLGATWDSVDGLRFGASCIDFGNGLGATPSFIWQVNDTGDGAPLPPDGADYEFRVWYQRDQVTTGGRVPTTLALYVNGVEQGRVAVYGVGTIAAGFAIEYDHYAPPCLPDTASGGSVNTGVPFTITVTDLGSDVYRVKTDDPNQSGFLSDPGSPPFNDFGAAGRCVPGGGGAPCSTTTGLPVQAVSIIGPDTTTRTVISHPGTVVGYSSGPSGVAGFQITVDYDLGEQSIVDLEVGGFSVAAFQHRASLAQWVTDFGSGVPVTVNAASTTPVECYDTVNVLGGFGRTLFPAGYGFTVFSPDNPNPGTPSSVTEFTLSCVGPPGPSPTTLVPRIQLLV